MADPRSQRAVHGVQELIGDFRQNNSSLGGGGRGGVRERRLLLWDHRTNESEGQESSETQTWIWLSDPRALSTTPTIFPPSDRTSVCLHEQDRGGPVLLGTRVSFHRDVPETPKWKLLAVARWSETIMWRSPSQRNMGMGMGWG